MGKEQSKTKQFCSPLSFTEGAQVSTIAENDGDVSKLPVLSLSGVVLVPGQTLPLHLFQPNQVTLIQRLADNGEVFGIVTERFVSASDGHVKSAIGTTVEITSVEEDRQASSLKVKGLGSRRFQVLRSDRQIDGTVVATVRYLADRELSPPLQNIMLSCQKRSLLDSFSEHSNITNRVERTRKVGRFSAADFTPWPAWVYKQYDTRSVMTHIKKELATCNNTLNDVSDSKQPLEYSFWLMANLPMDDQLKLSLLSIITTIQRLRCELAIVKSCSVLFCKDCGLFIADKKDVFSMAREGPLGMYVNPGGYIHEMITVYKADGLKTAGGPSTENTWFQGFAWTVVQCKYCTAHIGWKFTALSRGLVPQKFWGVCRSAILPGIRKGIQFETHITI